MKPGRNDPCPCGSGKKYKHCCLVSDQARPEAEILWHRLKRVNEDLFRRLVDTAVGVFGNEAVAEAWDEFTLWEDVPFDPESPHCQVFWPWFLYDWQPDESDTRVKQDAPRELTIAGAYLKHRGDRVDPLQRRYLLACMEAPFSFYDIVACDPGKGLLLRDIFTGDEHHVTERLGSQGIRIGDILFAKIAILEEIAELDGTAPVPFPPFEKAPILALREQMALSGQRITRDFLKEYDIEMFGIYHDIAERLLNPPVPELRNTDGDPLLFHRLIYDIDSPEVVFGGLKELALGIDEKDLRSGAKYDTAGALVETEFPWHKLGNKIHKNWNNTILGNIRIEAKTLTVEVNSAKRAKKFATLANKLIGKNARYRTTVIESPEAMLARGTPDTNVPARAEQEALMAEPEVQAMLTRHYEAYYEQWLNEKIPALGGKTPRQAVKTAAGREMVEALLVGIERAAQDQNVPGCESIVPRLRERLKLD